MKLKNTRSNKVPVIVIGNDNINNLGVVRSLGRHGIPTILLSSNHQDIARYSRFTNQRLKFPDPKDSEDEFIEFLLDLGRTMEREAVIIPTNDAAVFALSRHKYKLEKYFLLPVPDFKIVEKLVNKRYFYQFLTQLSLPYPRTYFPADLNELKNIGEEIEYPYIIKPEYMHLFKAVFGAKLFLVDSPEKLSYVIEKLEQTNLDVFIQDIIPGNDHYSLLTYLNRESKPCAVCGWDKIRQDPPFFGNSSVLCKTEWREEPISLALQTLQTLRYYGIAEPEFKKDPRDNEYKFLEINARSSIPNALAAKCGADIIYTAYLDTIGKYNGNSLSPQSGILWIDEINDLRVCLKQILKKKLSIPGIFRIFKEKHTLALAAWDDPLPLFISLLDMLCYYFKQVFTCFGIFRKK